MDEIISDILRKEGGYVNHPEDKGGPTNFGITQKTLSDYLGKPVSVEDVKNLTKKVAKEIYLSNYFYSPRIDQLPEQCHHLVLDMSVNHGSKNAIKIVQRVITLADVVDDITVDGVAGPQTFEAAKLTHEAMGNYFINAIVDERVNFYNAIVEHNPSQSVFLKGWINRAESFREAV